jgi:hypothetical protein
MRTLVMAIALLAAGALAHPALGDDESPESAPDTGAPAATEAPAAPDAPSETMDLGDDHDSFAPYTNERHPYWSLLPAMAIAIVLLHLRKSKPQPKLVKAKDGQTG